MTYRNEHDLLAVSYTHLDVYKRQVCSCASDSVQHPWHGQCEFGNFRVEVRTVLGHHLVSPFHGADRGGQRRAAGILKAFAGLEQGLLADDAEAEYFLHLVVGIGDDPVAGNQLRRHFADILDGNGIGCLLYTSRCV